MLVNVQEEEEEVLVNVQEEEEEEREVWKH